MNSKWGRVCINTNVDWPL